jgi:hypothetical protein
LQFHSNECI